MMRRSESTSTSMLLYRYVSHLVYPCNTFLFVVRRQYCRLQWPLPRNAWWYTARPNLRTIYDRCNSNPQTDPYTGGNEELTNGLSAVRKF